MFCVIFRMEWCGILNVINLRDSVLQENKIFLSRVDVEESLFVDVTGFYSRDQRHEFFTLKQSCPRCFSPETGGWCHSLGVLEEDGSSFGRPMNVLYVERSMSSKNLGCCHIF